MEDYSVTGYNSQNIVNPEFSTIGWDSIFV